jgi:hypothetical protein
MNLVTSDLDLFELLVGHFDSGLIFVRIGHCLYFEPSARFGAADQIDDRLIKWKGTQRKPMLIIDHKNRLPRVATLAKLLADYEPTVVEQVYGKSEKSKPGEITPERRAQIEKIVSGHDLVLLHAGDNQHLVEATLMDAVFQDARCIVYSGGTFPSRIRSVLSDNPSEAHAELPILLEETIEDSWVTSRDATNLRACTEKVRQGVSPRSAVESIFGDQELEVILDRLFCHLKDCDAEGAAEATETLKTGQNEPADPQVAVRQARIEALKSERDVLFKAYFKRKRGW